MKSKTQARQKNCLSQDRQVVKDYALDTSLTGGVLLSLFQDTQGMEQLESALCLQREQVEDIVHRLSSWLQSVPSVNSAHSDTVIDIQKDDQFISLFFHCSCNLSSEEREQVFERLLEHLRGVIPEMRILPFYLLRLLNTSKFDQLRGWLKQEVSGLASTEDTVFLVRVLETFFTQALGLPFLSALASLPSLLNQDIPLEQASLSVADFFEVLHRIQEEKQND